MYFFSSKQQFRVQNFHFSLKPVNLLTVRLPISIAHLPLIVKRSALRCLPFFHSPSSTTRPKFVPLDENRSIRSRLSGAISLVCSATAVYTENMYVGVDVGGTKTLVAVLSARGEILEQIKLPTSDDYQNFLLELRHLQAHLEHQDFTAGGVGIAGRIDRQHGRRFAAGKLRWDGVPIQADLERIFHCPFVIENDAKVAALSEAMLLKERFSKVLYVTVSTGIGYAVVNNGQVDTALGDRGGTSIMVEHRGKHVDWESLASGRAIVKRYGKRASEIDDAATWAKICRELATGLVQLIAIVEPEVIVIGGSVGTYFERYGEQLAHEIAKHAVPAMQLPELRKAGRPELAVVYGCYDLAHQKLSHD